MGLREIPPCFASGVKTRWDKLKGLRWEERFIFYLQVLGVFATFLFGAFAIASVVLATQTKFLDMEAIKLARLSSLLELLQFCWASRSEGRKTFNDCICNIIENGLYLPSIMAMLGDENRHLAASASTCPVTPSSTSSATLPPTSFTTTVFSPTSIPPGPASTMPAPAGYVLPATIGHSTKSTGAMAGYGLALQFVLLVIAALLVFFLRFSGETDSPRASSEGGNKSESVSLSDLQGR